MFIGYTSVFVIETGQELLQIFVLNLREVTGLELLVLLKSQRSKSVLTCIIGDACHFIGRSIAILRFLLACNDTVESEVITFTLAFHDVPAYIAE